MGLGLGRVRRRGLDAALGGVPYLAFLAPGLLAATAMQSAAFEATFPIMAGSSGAGSSTRCTRRRSRRATSRSATSPGSPSRLTLDRGDLHDRHRRCSGRPTSPLDRAGDPGGGPDRPGVRARRSRRSRRPSRRRDTFNAIFRFVITPLFLFCGTFFPIEPAAGVPPAVAWLTPLCHGVALSRGAVARDDRRRRRSLALVHVALLLDARRRRDVARRSGRSERRLVQRMTGACRIAPRVLPFGSRRSLRLIERNLLVYKHGWMVILSGLLRAAVLPARRSASGSGALVGDVAGPGGAADPVPAVRRAGAAGQRRR